MTFDVIKAIFLGVVEGLTEFIPVSSTGHLLLVQQFFGFGDDNFGKNFAVLIQFGAILALLSIYAARLWKLFLGMFTDPEARRFIIGVVIAFLPAAIIGATAYKLIKEVLFNPWIVCVSLIVGGAVLFWIDRIDLKPRYNDAQHFTLPMYLIIGIAQCLSMIPGVSRSGATIVAAMLLGAEKRAAAEFSFWLAMPTMAGAFAYDLYKSHGQMGSGHAVLIAIGFAVSFVSAWVVVKSFLNYVSRHGFELFAWWRVIVGVLGLAALILGF
jgi:undecaprenyl-diphosphatase